MPAGDPEVEARLDACLGDIHEALERSRPQMASSRVEAQALLEGILGFTAPPELLQTLERMAAADEDSPLRSEVGAFECRPMPPTSRPVEISSTASS